jgi:hypothetical protein
VPLFIYFRLIENLSNMPIQPEVRTDHATEDDRRLMRTVLRKPLSRKLMVYLPITLLSIGGLVLINTFDVRFDMNETKRGIWNVVLVVLAAFPFRLAISDLMSYNKDLTNFQVKEAKGIVKSVAGKTIVIGTYEFDISALKGVVILEGDRVELRAGYKTNGVFLIAKKS